MRKPLAFTLALFVAGLFTAAVSLGQQADRPRISTGPKIRALVKPLQDLAHAQALAGQAELARARLQREAKAMYGTAVRPHLKIAN